MTNKMEYMFKDLMGALFQGIPQEHLVYCFGKDSNACVHISVKIKKMVRKGARRHFVFCRNIQFY